MVNRFNKFEQKLWYSSIYFHFTFFANQLFYRKATLHNSHQKWIDDDFFFFKVFEVSIFKRRLEIVFTHVEW